MPVTAPSRTTSSTIWTVCTDRSLTPRRDAAPLRREISGREVCADVARLPASPPPGLAVACEARAHLDHLRRAQQGRLGDRERLEIRLGERLDLDRDLQ